MIQPDNLAQPRYPQLQKREAESRQSEAKIAADVGDTGRAEALLAEALLAHPSLMTTYRQLGRLYAEKGETDAAERCYRGFLPQNFISKHFNQSYPGADASNVNPDVRCRMRFSNESSIGRRVVSDENESFVRYHCANPVKRSIASPTSLTSTSDSMFDSSELTSSVALVDQVFNGKLWFDGHNRMVLDQSEQLLEPHTRGNPGLLHAICQEHEPCVLPGRCFLISNRGFNNYYHWMVDILPSVGLFQQCDMNFRESDWFVVQNGSSVFQKSCLKHLGIREEQVIEVRKHSPYIQADELIVPFFSNAMAMTMGSWIPRFLKSTFLNSTSCSPIESRKIYLARATDARNGRGIPNEPELIAHLEQRGFVAIFPERYSVTEQAAIFAQADVVIAAHGAGLTNIVFCRPGTTIIELYGDYMASCYWAISAICGLHYLNHYCRTGTEPDDSGYRSHEFIQELRQMGFAVDLNELDRLLDLAEDTHARLS
jgi:capsular polysaccharide biosynthesis protein